MSSLDRPSSRQKRRSFGLSWWGNAWVEAVEKQSDLDQSRLPRGRTYARWGYVGPLTLKPGIVTSRVAGSKATPYHTHVKVNVLTDAEWQSLFDVVAGKIAHAAALMDGELTSELVDDARAAGINLLPTAGEISTGCSCADAADLCKHAAAVCYLVADLLDEDPFALLELRGRDQAEVSAALRARRQRPASLKPVAGPKPSDEVIAKAAFAERIRPALPRVPKLPSQPSSAVLAAADMPQGSDVDPLDLLALAQAAAQRAWEMSAGVGNSGLRDSAHLDLIRRLAPLLGTPEFDVLCSRTRITKSTAQEDARLWSAGGELAMEEAKETWDPERELLETGIEYLSSDGPTKITVRNNRINDDGTGRQLRLGESGTWYEYQMQSGRWRFKAIADI